jgi:hypothetical protein
MAKRKQKDPEILGDAPSRDPADESDSEDVYNPIMPPVEFLLMSFSGP